MKTIWICVYRDTIEEHDDDWNLTEVLVTKEFAEQYFYKRVMKRKWNGWRTFNEFINEYCADDTEDFYGYAMKYNAVIETKNW